MTNRVKIEGWRDQINPQPISLVDAIRRHAKLSLPAAKKLLDSLAENGTVDVDLPSLEDANAFAEEATLAGAIVTVTK